MIKKLKKRFILISAVSVVSLVLLIFSAMLLFNISSIDRNMDVLADAISVGGGRFPHPPSAGDHSTDKEKPFNLLSREAPFSTRYFTVTARSESTEVNTDSIYSVEENEALEYASEVIKKGRSRGWISLYRYKIYDVQDGVAVVFVDGAYEILMLIQSMSISAAVLLTCGALVLIFMILLSDRILRPIADSYEKQRQFVTDANHELKTPLTLILADLDLAEAELGKNEWLSDMRDEGNRMADLISRLAELSRLDESEDKAVLNNIDISSTVAEAAAEFRALAHIRGKHIVSDVAQGIIVKGDEVLVERLLSILLDNAIKYCDSEGTVTVSLKKRYSSAELTVENDYKEVSSLPLDKLFDRFYRADPARTYGKGHGIGLSTAKEIVDRLGGSISAYPVSDNAIGFRVIFK